MARQRYASIPHYSPYPHLNLRLGARPGQAVAPGPAPPALVSRLFNGTASDYLQAADSASLRSPSTAITAACWAKATASTQAQYAVLLHKRDAAVLSYQIDQDTTNNRQMIGVLGVLGTNYVTADSTAMVVGTWYFLVLRWTSGAVIKLDIYNADGSSFSSVTSAGTVSGTIDYNTGLFYVGNGYGLAKGWTGDIANVFLHNAALSDADVQTLLAGSLPAGSPSALWCPFYGASPEVDASGHGNDLTVNGTTVDTAPP